MKIQVTALSTVTSKSLVRRRLRLKGGFQNSHSMAPSQKPTDVPSVFCAFGTEVGHRTDSCGLDGGDHQPDLRIGLSAAVVHRCPPQRSVQHCASSCARASNGASSGQRTGGRRARPCTVVWTGGTAPRCFALVHAVLVRMVRSAPPRCRLGRRGRQLLSTGQARWRVDWPEPHQPRQARDQVPRKLRTPSASSRRRPPCGPAASHG